MPSPPALRSSLRLFRTGETLSFATLQYLTGIRKGSRL
jgi:hypothetical protein